MKNALKIICVAALLLPLSAASAASIVIDIKDIIGQPKSVVENKLGKAVSCSASKYGQKCIFSKSEIEIVFIDAKADWITINKIAGAPYAEDSLALLGLPPKKPTFSNANVMRWTNISGILEVSLFPAQSGVDYAYIKVKTK